MDNQETRQAESFALQQARRAATPRRLTFEDDDAVQPATDNTTVAHQPNRTLSSLSQRHTRVADRPIARPTRPNLPTLPLRSVPVFHCVPCSLTCAGLRLWDQHAATEAHFVRTERRGQGFHFAGERLKKSSARRPLFSECCGQNKLSFPLLPDPPEPLKQLLTGQDTRATRFRRHIRAYNNALCLASVGANWVSRGPGRSTFNPTMTLQGRIYHYMGPLRAAETRSPAFLSVYIHDTVCDCGVRPRSCPASLFVFYD